MVEKKFLMVDSKSQGGNVTSSLYVMMILLMVVTGTGHVGESAYYAIGKK
jgi:hypothetical protein